MLILGAISEFFVGIAIWICTGLYSVAAVVFKLFLILAQGELVDPDSYAGLITNFYVIIGVVMLFIIAFTLLKGIVNPDDSNKGTTAIKKMIVNLITSSIIMAVLPTVFEFAFDFQASIFRQGTIGKIFGYGSLTSENLSGENASFVETGAYSIVNGVFTAFFNANIDAGKCIVNSNDDLRGCQDHKEFRGDETYFWKLENGTLEPTKAEPTLLNAIDSVDYKGNFGVYSAFAEKADIGNIDFNFLLSLVGGILLIYVGISYSLDMGVRLVKLVFYQIIAPIPIFLRILPDGKASGSFNQWLKIVLTCYMEVFIRIFILYFCIYLCNAMLESDFLGKDVYQYGYFLALLAKAVVIIGIITFMKQAPKLLSEITGIDSGNMKLGIKDKLAAGGAFTAGAAVGSLFTAGARNFTNKYLHKDNWKNKDGKVTAGSVLKNLGGGIGSIAAGAVSGAVRGGKAGWSAKSFKDMSGAASKGATAAVNARDKRANYKAAHGGTLGAIGGHIKDFGLSTKNYFMDESIEGLTRESANMGKLASKYSAFSDGIEGLLEKEQSKGGGSVFAIEADGTNKNGFSGAALTAYGVFDDAAKKLAEARTQFNLGKITADDLRKAEGTYTEARDHARDELMNIALKGSKGSEFMVLNAKGQAALKDSLVNAQSLQATIVENADSAVVQSIMGDKGNGNGKLKDIVAGKPINVDAFKDKTGKTKLKDAAKVAQGQADIKIAEMNKEQAAKGDKK